MIPERNDNSSLTGVAAISTGTSFRAGDLPGWTGSAVRTIVAVAVRSPGTRVAFTRDRVPEVSRGTH